MRGFLSYDINLIKKGQFWYSFHLEILKNLIALINLV